MAASRSKENDTMAQVRRGSSPLDRSGETWNLIYRFGQHWPLAMVTGLLFAGAGLIYASRYQPLYHAEAQVRVGDALDARAVPGQKEDSSEFVELPDTLASGFRSRFIVDQKLQAMAQELSTEPRLSHIASLQTEKGRDELVEGIKKNAQVEAVTRRVFRVVYEANDPDLAQLVTQKLAEIGVSDVAGERGRNAQQARLFLTTETEAARKQMLAAEAQVVRFLKDHPKILININAADKGKLGLNLAEKLLVGKGGGSTVRPLVQLEKTVTSPQVRALMNQKAEAEARVQQIEGRLKFDSTQPKSAELDRLQQQLMDLKAQGYTKDYPEYRRVQTEIDRVMRDIQGVGTSRDPKLAQDMRILAEAKAQIAAIDREIAIHKRKAAGEDKPLIPDEGVISAEAQYARLVRDMESARVAYEKLHERELDAQVNEELSKLKSNLAARIEDPAKRPLFPRGVSRKMMTLLCVMLGMAMGLGLGLLRALTDPLIYTVYDLAKASRLPVLGRVPRRDSSDAGEVGEVAELSEGAPVRALSSNGVGSHKALQAPESITVSTTAPQPVQGQGAAASATTQPAALPAAPPAKNGTTPPQPPHQQVPLNQPQAGSKTGEYMVVFSAQRTGQFAQVPAPSSGSQQQEASATSDVMLWSDKGLPVSSRSRSAIFASPQSAAFRLAGMGHNIHKASMEEHPHLFLLSAPDGSRAEQYRLLRCRLQDVGDPKVIMVTSAVRSEGKTMAAANLALAYAEGGAHSVALLDANLSAPLLTEILGAQPRAEALTENDLTSGGLDIWQFESNLFLVPALGPKTKRSSVLSSPAFAMLLSDLRQVFEYIIIDSPAASSAADAKIVLRNADTGLFFTKARSTTAQAVRVALDRLGRGSMAGVVLNEFSRS